MKVEELEAIIDVINEAQTIEKEQDPDEFAGTELKIVIDGDKLIIAAEMLRRSRLRCCGVPRCAATR